MQNRGISFEYQSGFVEKSPEEQLLHEMRLCQIREAVDRLPETEKAVIVGVYWEEKTQSVLAEELGISQPAVNARKKQALKKLRGLLGGSLL